MLNCSLETCSYITQNRDNIVHFFLLEVCSCKKLLNTEPAKKNSLSRAW